MKTIWKYPLKVVGQQHIKLPTNHVLLAVQMQDDTPCLWAMVEPCSPPVSIAIATHGTGHPLPASAGAYIGTYQHDGLVLHAFNVGVVE